MYFIRRKGIAIKCTACVLFRQIAVLPRVATDAYGYVVFVVHSVTSYCLIPGVCV